MRYACFLSVIATKRIIQPSPRSQFQGKNAKVTRLPVTESRSPPTFSIPKIPFENNLFDTIISTECFEHDPEWEQSLKKIYEKTYKVKNSTFNHFAIYQN